MGSMHVYSTSTAYGLQTKQKRERKTIRKYNKERRQRQDGSGKPTEERQKKDGIGKTAEKRRQWKDKRKETKVDESGEEEGGRSAKEVQVGEDGPRKVRYVW
jgi:hypothetical protein